MIWHWYGFLLVFWTIWCIWYDIGQAWVEKKNTFDILSAFSIALTLWYFTHG